MTDWDPGKYQRFSDLRLRPALDLIAAIPELPDGDVVDLGCGAGAVAAELAEQFPRRALVGVDTSRAMLDKAQDLGLYARLDQADISHWRPGSPPALIYSNAALHWVPDHHSLLPELAQSLPAGGVLAVQVPHQNPAPSHQSWIHLAHQLFPGRVAGDGPGILSPEEYFDILSPLGQLRLWQTEYLQRLDPVAQGHPVRHFTESTFARPILNALTSDEQETLISAYEDAMQQAYPIRADGAVLFPFRRLFFTLRR